MRTLIRRTLAERDPCAWVSRSGFGAQTRERRSHPWMQDVAVDERGDHHHQHHLPHVTAPLYRSAERRPGSTRMPRYLRSAVR